MTRETLDYDDAMRLLALAEGRSPMTFEQAFDLLPDGTDRAAAERSWNASLRYLGGESDDVRAVPPA